MPTVRRAGPQRTTCRQGIANRPAQSPITVASESTSRRYASRPGSSIGRSNACLADDVSRADIRTATCVSTCATSRAADGDSLLGGQLLEPTNSGCASATAGSLRKLADASTTARCTERMKSTEESRSPTVAKPYSLPTPSIQQSPPITRQRARSLDRARCAALRADERAVRTR